MLALRDLGLQLQIRICQLDGPLGHPMLEGLVQPAQFSLRPLLQPEVAADGRNIHRLSGARIVDAEPIHKERDLRTQLEMAKVDLADPAPLPHHDRPHLVAQAGPVIRKYEVENMRPAGLFHAGEPDKPEPGRIDVLRNAVETGDTDEVGGALDQREITALIGLRLPSLQRDGGLVGANPEQEPLALGRKIRPMRAGHENGLAAESDGSTGKPHRAFAPGIGDLRRMFRRLSGRSRQLLALQCGSDCADGLGGNPHAGPRELDTRRLAPAGQRDMDEVRAEHRHQRRRDAVGNLAGIVGVPNSRQRRQRNQVTNAAPQLLGIGELLHPLHDARLSWHRHPRAMVTPDRAGCR